MRTYVQPLRLESQVTAALWRFYFFFSSRRRHTRCSRDWSSDVCSSDLFVGASAAPSQAPAAKPQRIPKACKLLRRETSDAGKVSSKLMVVRLALTDPSQDNEPGQKYDQRHPKEIGRAHV